ESCLTARAIRGALWTALAIGGLGGAEMARAAPMRPAPARWAAAADTDSVARRDSLARNLPDSLAVPADTDSVAGPVLVPPDTARDDSLPPAPRPDSAAQDTTEEGPPFPDRDEFFDRLAEESGFRVIEYRGREVELDVEAETVRLDREAQARYGNSILDARSILYWVALQFIEAERDIRLEGEGRNVTSDSIVYYDVSQTKGSIMDARTSFAEQGAEWFVRGDATPRGSRTVFVETGNFTSCELEQPHYFFRAGQIKVVTQDIIVAWPVTLYIQDVPVAWLPFFAQDIRDGRRSGFLPPRFGVNDIVSTSSDIRRSVTDFGYYFALNDYMDAQATVDWFSGRFTRLNAGFRYKVLKKFFDGNLFASYSLGDERALEIRARHNQDITPVTSLRLNATYASNTRVLERQSFDPTLQTQRISSDLGLQHRFPFASVNLSASRRQSLGTQSGNTELTLPNLQMTFSPVQLFSAPRNVAGPFNNIVVNGGFSFSRLSQNFEERDDVTTERAAANSAIRIGSFGVGGNANFQRRTTSPFDSVGAEATDPFSETRVDYNASADYQVDLVGSTTFRPTVSLSSSLFRSMDTDGEFVAAPTRMRFGATLSTDLYGFLPGFGPFARIRHKVSPRFSYDYSPAVEAADSLLMIPGFPISNARAENRLSVTLNQTFEAKLRDDVELDEDSRAVLEGRSLDEDSLAVADDSLFGGEAIAPPDSVAAARDSIAADSLAAARAAPDSLGSAQDSAGLAQDTTGAPRRARQQRNVVLLGINSSSLDFDFARENEPALTTDRWNHRINSDLLRGLSLNLAFDLFEGVGEERTFAPILSSLTGSFTFSSASGLGGLLGLGGGGTRRTADPRQRLRGAADSRYRLQSFDENPDPMDPGLRSGGPWTLSLTYSLQRGREEQSAQDRQSLNAILSLNPTPNWRLSWRTSYNLSDGEFGEHLVTLDRDLHRWVATFMFARSPNGNFIFQMSVNLRDAPDLKFDYDQQSLDR
ncbi:MAG: putative LPS assembly protein LptD, partial [Gemmatimonadota bacterium]|nr:putative LPS assembly protein LptD [Gemmatimonadota bacterium]